MAKEIRDARFPTCPFVFNHDGHCIVDFRKAWKSACTRANVPGLLFHDLRRSAIRNMRLAGIQENVAMAISGHRTRSIFDRYNIISPRDLNDAAAKMEERLKASLGTITGTIGDETSDEAETNGRQGGDKPLN